MTTTASEARLGAGALSGETAARRRVFFLIASLAVLTYLDRLCISAAAPAIAKEFALTPSQLGFVFSAFTIAYALFEVPAGWLGDRIGARKAIARVVLWWSLFTALTPLATGFSSLVALRFLFGAGEAGAFPNSARSISRWFPAAERGRALSASFIGTALGGAVAAPLVFKLVAWQGWRPTFVVFGMVGAVWVTLWWQLYRDDPESDPRVGAAELRWIRSDGPPAAASAPPWRALLRSRNLWCICLMYLSYGYSLYFYITWLPSWLLKARGFSAAQSGFFSALPWVVGACGFWLGGQATDWLARNRGLKVARSGLGAAGYLCSAAALVGVAVVEGRVAAASLVAVAAFFQMLTCPCAWAVCLDVGKRQAGVVSGFMNTLGNVGGTAAPIVVGVAVERWGSWTLPFYVTAAVLAVGAVFWLLVEPGDSVLGET